jgi:hypothetical protein
MSAKRFAVAALVATLLPAPLALAQIAPPATDLLAIIVAGLSPGDTAEMPIRGVVQSPEAGVFTLEGEGTMVTVTITESERCVFAVQSAIPGYPTVTLHLNANKIRTMSVVPSGERDDLHRYDLTLTGEGAVTIETPDGTFPGSDEATQIVSSIDLDMIEFAIDEFRGMYCPGLAG